ncbi:MAG TPA: uracil-DNA glycosylase [Hyphomonadaceae bacterium]|nr:uracil-DNA glycosylase [Hyphomonadaceae bacterium]
MTHPPTTPDRAHLALKALTEFWADMGLEEARAFTIPRQPAQRAPTTSRSSAPVRQTERPPGSLSTGPAGQIAGQLGSPQLGGPRPAPRRINNNPIADARRLASAANTLAELRAAIEGFNGCELKKAAKTTVVCDGAFGADIMIVGEAPGGEEDAQGLPFVGRAGQLLDKMLATVGLSRKENVYITNLIYWRPPGNRDPSPAEMQICAPFLTRQIELKKPKLLLTAGKFATQAMLGTEDGIMRLRGRKLLYRQEGIPAPIKCVPLLHPAYLLRRPEDKAKAWDDLRTIATLCDDLGIKRSPAL